MLLELSGLLAVMDEVYLKLFGLFGLLGLELLELFGLLGLEGYSD